MSISSFGQTFYAKYTVLSSAGVEKLLGAKAQLKVTYNIWANDRYIRIVGKEDTLLVSGKVSLHKEQIEILISVEKELAFFPNEKRYVKIKPYLCSKEKQSGNISSCYLSATGTLIEYSDAIPKNLNPVLSFNHGYGGVKKVSSENLSINIVSWEEIKMNLNFDEIFRHTPSGLSEFGFFD